jgi:hypothetical protein
VLCLAGILFVIKSKLESLHLERVVDYKSNSEITHNSDPEVDCTFCSSTVRKISGKKTIEIAPIRSPFNIMLQQGIISDADSMPLLLFPVNTKRLIDEIYNGIQVLTPPTPAHARSLSKTSSSGYSNTHSYSKSNSPKKFINQLATRLRSKKRSEKLSVEIQRRPITTRGDKPDSDIVQAIFSSILSWGLDIEIDNLCKEKLGLQPRGLHVTMGLRGANGSFSLLAPSKKPSREFWNLSGTFNGSRLLNVIALSHSVLSTRGSEEYISALITHYGVMFPDIFGKSFKYPSFSLLTKYWQDPVMDIQQAARSIFVSIFSKMSFEEKMAVVNYWKGYLPKSGSFGGNKVQMRAAVILGIFGMIDKTFLPLDICKVIAESLDSIMYDEQHSNYATQAIEILGAGFGAWEPHINGANLLRKLIFLTGLIAGAPPVITGNPESPTQIRSTSIRPVTMVAARRSIDLITDFNPGLVISTLNFDLIHLKSHAERSGCLKLMTIFFSKVRNSFLTF